MVNSPSLPDTKKTYVFSVLNCFVFKQPMIRNLLCWMGFSLSFVRLVPPDSAGFLGLCYL